MKDIAAHELPILVPDSGPLSGVSPTGPTASTSGLYVFNVGVVEHRAIPNLKPDDLLVFSLELVSPGYKSQKGVSAPLQMPQTALCHAVVPAVHAVHACRRLPTLTARALRSRPRQWAWATARPRAGAWRWATALPWTQGACKKRGWSSVWLSTTRCDLLFGPHRVHELDAIKA